MSAHSGRGEASEKPIVDYESLVQRLVDRRDQLSRRHAELAQFCLNHPEEVAISTIVRLSDHADVPAATITRFAKELGFSGFPELQAVFRERVLGPGPSYSRRLSDVSSRTEPESMESADFETPEKVFEGLTTAAINSLVRIDQNLDRNALTCLVRELVSAEVVHIIAARGAFGIGAYTLYGLANIGKRAHLIDNLGAMRREQIAAIGPNDVALAITFDDYTPETVEAANEIVGRGHSLLAITDNELSPIANIASHRIFVQEARLGHFRSQVPALVVCQSIIVSVGRAMS